MTHTLYRASRVFTGDRMLQDACLVVHNGTIEEITTGSAPARAGNVRDFGNVLLAPAFIDLQVYGGKGHLFANEPTPETIAHTYEEQLAYGTTWFQITLPTTSLQRMQQAIEACRTYQGEGGKGLIGLHLEGPYISAEKKGAHLQRYLHKPDVAELEQLLTQAQGIITQITLAPEVIDDACLDMLLHHGVKVSLGHSNATYAQAMHAIGRGAKHVTHLFNAMSQLQSRAPGLVGATFNSDATATIVADGIHVDYNAVAIAKKIMGPRLYYISDATTWSQGDYIFLKNEDHYTTADGTLAGSALTLHQAVVNGTQHAGISLEESLRMASSYPAIAAKSGSHLGKLEKGFRAQFVVLNERLDLVDVIV